MPIAWSHTFRDGNGEAPRLPEEIEPVIVRSGDMLAIFPAIMPISEMASRVRALPARAEVMVSRA